jgi:predicted O-linked N-acetylglucosamine transferase (SPINDLY family)
VAGSLLHAVGLPEMIAASLPDYEAIALRLAHDRDAHAAIRAKLIANRLTTPLFDTEQFTRGLEAAYESMWRRWCQGLPPEAIDIPAATPVS